MKKVFLIILFVVMMTITLKLLFEDMSTIDKAIDVQVSLIKFCEKYNRYPNTTEFKILTPWLWSTLQNPEDVWFYWPNKNLSMATFQYPMNLPLPSAPGHAKLSPFVPVIYANAVINPCKLK